jgi:hypothetical protein
MVKQAKAALEAWVQIDGALKLGDLTVESLSTNLEEAATLEARITALETQLTHLRNERQSSYNSIWDKLKRLRGGIKAIFGDDSSQYEMVGGTRASERKSRARKVAATE